MVRSDVESLTLEIHLKLIESLQKKIEQADYYRMQRYKNDKCSICNYKLDASLGHEKFVKEGILYLAFYEFKIRVPFKIYICRECNYKFFRKKVRKNE